MRAPWISPCISPHCLYSGCTLYIPVPLASPCSPGSRYTRVPGTWWRWRHGASGCPRLWLSGQNDNLKRSELKNQKICSCTEALSLAPVVAKTLGLPEVLFLALPHGLCDELDLEASGFQKNHICFSSATHAMLWILVLICRSLFYQFQGPVRPCPAKIWHASTHLHCQLPSVNSYTYLFTV